MILGIGIDLCDVTRMEKALTNSAFLEKYFTCGERTYIHSRGKAAAESLAGNFAAKEAGLKALGCGIILPLTDISVIHDASGAPYFHLVGEALRLLHEKGGKIMHLSITHTDTVAAAVAVIEG